MRWTLVNRERRQGTVQTQGQIVRPGIQCWRVILSSDKQAMGCWTPHGGGDGQRTIKCGLGERKVFHKRGRTEEEAKLIFLQAEGMFFQA